MDQSAHLDDNGLIAGKTTPGPMTAPDDLSWAVVKLRAVERIVVNELLIAAYQAAFSPHSIRALKSDLEAFYLWCRRHNRVALPATPETLADYLDARSETGSKPASLGRYKASIAKIHLLLDLKDPAQASLVKLRLQAIRRRLGTAQRQARPLRFKGPVRNVERDEPRGLNVRALLESCDEVLPGLRNRALLSAGAMTPGCARPSWSRLRWSISSKRSIPMRGCLASRAARAIRTGRGRLPISARGPFGQSRPGSKPPASRPDRCSGA